jgi:D-alanyl-D-alanine carboxypeptidase
MDGDIDSRLRRAVDDERRRYDFPAVVLHVTAPRAGLDATFASGLRDLRSRTPITGDEVFRIASITKTITSACVLRLMETGKLELDAPIADLLPDEYTSLLRDGGYDPDRISARHLLQHVSGIHDSPAIEELILAEPGRRWSPLDWILVTMEGASPLGDPGEVFKYFDHGYTLLGRIVERATRLPQPQAYRRLIPFDTIGLDYTWFESLEPRPPGATPQAHQYFRGRDIEILDPSVDLYGGGGLLSSVTDLARFYRALFSGKVFDDPTTLDTMLQIPTLAFPVNYAMGIERRTVAGVTYWGHTGFWGSGCFHAPDIDLTFACTRNVHDTPEGHDGGRLVALLSELFSSSA